MSNKPERRRRFIRATAPAFGLLAAGLLVWQGSYAAFSATTNNTGDSWSTGKLVLTNNGGTAVYAASTTGIFNEALVKPGSGNAKCLTVESTGTLAGALKVYRGAITGVGNSVGLATAMTLTVDAASVTAATNVPTACTGFPGGSTNVYTGTLNGLPSTYAGALVSMPLTGAATERMAYRFTWSLPGAVVDNTLMSSSAIADLNFEVQ
jgi:hypothetical protein